MAYQLLARPQQLAVTGIHRWSRALAFAIAGAFMARNAGAQTPQPLTLAVLLDSVARHPSVAAARARARAAEGSRVTAGAFGNPVLAYLVDNTPFPGGPQLRGIDREGMTTLTLPLEPLYQRSARTRVADAQVRGAVADASAVRQRVALDASRAFYRTALAQIGVATSQDLLAWLDSVVVYNRSRVNAGVTAEADLIRSQLERDRAAVDATMQEADLARARATLATFLGDPRKVDVDSLSVSIDALPIALPTGAVTDRSELRAARERLSAASAGASVERTMILRQFAATFGTMQSAGTTSMIAGLSLPIPLFDPNRGEIARADAERDVAAYDLTAVERETTAEVAGAYSAAVLLTERATVFTGDGRATLLTRADDARRIALGAYREGAVPLLQVLDAARAWGDARMAYYRLIYAQRESVLTLLVARGDDLIDRTLNRPAAR